ncbi:MAG: 23S rRNA (adenine(2503)-C(2))-methyltransferase RlmN [Clostridiales bacterium]|nr:23S rRNA (adenine(2503)-C(2))-methyltransferase RlmN [Clostridiales bacterium]
MDSIRELSIKELEKIIINLNEKKFRAKQIFQWIHQKGAEEFDEMTNLPNTLINKLKENYILRNMTVERISESDNDGTKKLLFKLSDDEVVETVVMQYKYGNSVCISTQVGCRMGCKFCASTIGGLKRNITVGEMLGQVYESNKYLQKNINHIVLMGSGEPLENLDEVIKFLKMINDPQGYYLSLRNITISTCGLVPQIRKLADENFQITLAISLHGARNETRNKLMPINRKYPIEELMKAVDYYIETTNRRITFEYAMIKDLNDSDEEANVLAKLLKGKLVHVNLIPINKVEENDFYPSDEKQIYKFKNILEKSGINVTIRRELGSDINAACGQLRNNYNLTKIEIIKKL